MVLLRTQARFQQDGGHPVPNIARTTALRINHNQPEAGCSPEAGLRGCRLRFALCRLGCWDSQGKGCQATGCTCRQLLTAEQGKRLLQTADGMSLRGKRDYATLAILLGCGLRRAELTALRVEDIQQREEHWVIADLVGKGGHIRTIPVPDWVKAGIDAWTAASGITAGILLRSINKAGRVWGFGFSPKVIWGVVKRKAKDCEIPALAPHVLRRTCARLCHQAGGELEQIQFLLGHVSVQTTERYLGCKQRFRNAVDDRIGLEPGTLEPQ